MDELLDARQRVFMLTLITVVAAVVHLKATEARSEGVRGLYSDAFRGEQRTAEMLAARPLRLRRYCRLLPSQFDQLLHRLDGLKDGQLISRQQKLLIFLWSVAQDRHYREIAEEFQHSLSTVSTVWNEALNALLMVYQEFVQPAKAADSLQLADKGGKYWPWFEGAVGALDGTHIFAQVATNKQAAYRNRKGGITQNVLAVVDFNGRFTFILAGWEGSAHDGRVLADAVDSGQFEAPAEGRYWLADAGYSNSAITMVPYRGVRYHLREQHMALVKPQNAKELFNLRHSSLRNVVERAFGVFKRRFRVFQTAPAHPMKTQIKLVYVCAALHNFLTIDGLEVDEAGVDEEALDGSSAGSVAPEGVEDAPMAERRDAIADAMWKDYIDYNQRK